MQVLSGFGRRDAALSMVTLAELNVGIRLLPPSVRRDGFEIWVSQEIERTFAGRILPVTLDILVEWVALTQRLKAKGRSQSAADVLIASTARVHNLTVVTRNTRDFASTGVTVYNPWTEETQKMEAP
jgi:predicted nucleic acid-binding protein